MDFNNVTKPLHIRCPKCKAELEYNPMRIKQRLEKITALYTRAVKSLAVIPDKNTRDAKKREAERLLFEMRLLKEDINMVNVMAKEEINAIKIHKLKKEVGEARYIEICEEAEREFSAENIFSTYETAIQRYSTIADNVDGRY